VHRYIVQQWRKYLDANREKKGVYRETERARSRAGDQRRTLGAGKPALLVYFGKIHAVSVLQSGDLPRVELHFQVRRHNGNVDRLALRRVGAFGANTIKFNIPVMCLHEFVDDVVHFFIVLGVSKTANRSKTLEPSFISRSLVTLLA
jgi:hypothetical protein